MTGPLIVDEYEPLPLKRPIKKEVESKDDDSSDEDAIKIVKGTKSFVHKGNF